MLRYTSVESTIDVGADGDRFLHQVRGLVQDCVNQGGITTLRTLAMLLRRMRHGIVAYAR